MLSETAANLIFLKDTFLRWLYSDGFHLQELFVAEILKIIKNGKLESIEDEEIVACFKVL
jgi:hypothetical protein